MNAFETGRVLSSLQDSSRAAVFCGDPASGDRCGFGDRRAGRLKILSPDIIHKSDVGGVAFNLKNSLEVLVSATEMMKRVRDLAPPP
ncbi:MAG: acetate--CoA ligase family protein [Candidatus Competibacteraceae bacterium]|nr:acetate--CoA ligase family protein [Candidatus Competibacteraceae bacterium]